MLVAVMRVRKVLVRMHQVVVAMPMRVARASWNGNVVSVLMMLIVLVFMLMLHGHVHVQVAMVFGEM